MSHVVGNTHSLDVFWLGVSLDLEEDDVDDAHGCVLNVEISGTGEMIELRGGKRCKVKRRAL
jgi:hypothetical protein